MNRHHTANEAFGQTGDWLMSTVKNNPEAWLVLAAGCALLLRGAGRTSRTMQFDGHRQINRASDFAERESAHWRDGISAAAEKAGAYASEIKNRVAESASDYASSLSQYAGTMRRNVAESATAISDQAGELGRNISQQAAAASDYAGAIGRNIADQASRFTGDAHTTVQSGLGYMLREQPLGLVVLGVAAGAALAAVVPSTEAETKALGPAGEAIADSAAKVKENLMSAAGEAGEHLKRGAAERGLSTQSLKEMAQEAAGAFASKATGADAERGAAEKAKAAPSGGARS